MTMVGERRFRWLRDVLLILAPAAAVAVFVAALYAFVPSPPLSDKVTGLCDEQVQVLLTTKDPVELRRAAFLIRWFDCGIRRRLP